MTDWGPDMHFEIDTHTHTVLSGHAHSTLIENANAAAKVGLKGFVLSDHGPRIPAAPPDFNVTTYAYLPSHIEGVRVYHGVEANIIDFLGTLDIREKYLDKLEFVIAGMHEIVITPGTSEQNTAAIIGALRNKYVDIIAHPDNPSFNVDYEAVVKEAGRYEKLLELNDHSMEYRDGGIKNAEIFLELCKQHGVRICVSSDAHSAFGMGKFDEALKQIEASGFPESLIVNRTQKQFEAYIKERRARIKSI